MHSPAASPWVLGFKKSVAMAVFLLYSEQCAQLGETVPWFYRRESGAQLWPQTHSLQEVLWDLGLKLLPKPGGSQPLPLVFGKARKAFSRQTGARNLFLKLCRWETSGTHRLRACITSLKVHPTPPSVETRSCCRLNGKGRQLKLRWVT